METVIKEAFKIIGIKVRTTNENNQGGDDIPALWQKFMTENIYSKIPNKIDTSFLSVYTNYEKDYTKPYDMILGCKVSSLDDIPEGMVGQEFKQEKYLKFIAKGDLEQNVIYNTWTKIWVKDIDRTYTADFEVYGDTSKDHKNAEVDIFVAIK